MVERKDRFAETLGTFVQENFLTADGGERAAAGRPAPSSGWRPGWPAPTTPPTWRPASPRAWWPGTDLLRDEDVHRVLDALVRDRIDKVALAPLAGRVLQQLTREGRHEPLIDAALAALSRYLAEHGGELHHRLGVDSPWWLPGPVEDRMVASLLQRSRQVLDDMAAHPDHPLRQQLDAGLEKLAVDLQTSEEPAPARRGDQGGAARAPGDPGVRRRACGRTSRRSCAPRPSGPVRSCAPGWPA